MLLHGNKTTIEHIEKNRLPFESPFDMNKAVNLREYFGENKFYWWIPIYTGPALPNGNGLKFNKR